MTRPRLDHIYIQLQMKLEISEFPKDTQGILWIRIGSKPVRSLFVPLVLDRIRIREEVKATFTGQYGRGLSYPSLNP